jgi:hypothetical protein
LHAFGSTKASLTTREDQSAFYIDGRIELCPSACAAAKRDQALQVEILYGCTAIAI